MNCQLFVCLFVCFLLSLFVCLFACLLACLLACLFAYSLAGLLVCVLVCLFVLFVLYPLPFSTTKRVNTCWLPNLIWRRNPVSKMKSCNRSCSQRDALHLVAVWRRATDLVVRGSALHIVEFFHCLNLAVEHRNDILLWFMLGCLGTQKDYSLLLRVMLGLSNLLHADLRTICGCWPTVVFRHMLGAGVNL